MIIHNFYMVILYVLCIYSLLCFNTKLLLDRNIQKKAEKKEKMICDFLLFHSPKNPARASRIMKFAQDDLLFAYICDGYIKLSPQYTLQEQQKMSKYMQSLIENKIDSLAKEDVQTRCLILRYLFQMGIHSDTINQFVYGDRKRSKLEQAWIKTICLNENKVSKKNPCKGCMQGAIKK